MDVTFHNVTITLASTSPQAAYDELCEMFAVMNQRLARRDGAIEYTTDTYTIDASDVHASTSELFGKEGA